MSVTLADFRNLPLWQQMLTQVGSQELSVVEKHVSYILPRMEHYADTFRTYTLHNQEHIFNVVRIMGQILGDRISSVHGSEAMILILSAVYHDYGMIYSDEEKLKISSYEDFNREFLVEQTSAQVQYEENKRVLSDELAVWYCRWAHAKRVWPKLEEMETLLGRLMWNGIPIREAVGNVCASHNEPVENIRIEDSRFPTDFLAGVCDLRLSALLLRLADILDFDNSRSPKSVYDYLDLDNPKNHAEEISKDEWQKHMVSRGFHFPAEPQRTPLKFLAAPPHPYIEQGIRNFLDLVDYELTAVWKVSGLCSERWHQFPFPEKIDRTGIASDNYVSGKFRFSLSEDKILDLLTGDNLYNDDFVFIRELLQNAIDTVRHRAFIEQISDPSYDPRPIEVSYFRDPDGYYWLRIDDFGMGMSQGIIEKYLLNKGTSYYQSDEFKLEKIAISENSHRDFVPISRFGIGILSCFMTCDKIEINTCYFYAPEGESRQKTRLSIEGRAGYWIIRSEKKHHVADKMPGNNGWEKGYRIEMGTSIACRIKTAREFRGLNMAAQIDRFLLAPEIPVIFDGNQLGGIREELVKMPWCKYSKTALPKEFLEQCTNLLKSQVEFIEIEVRPIDITRMAADANLTGQLVVVIPRIMVKNDSRSFSTSKHFRLETEGKTIFLVCETAEERPDGKEIKTEVRHDITYIIESIQFPEKFLSDVNAYSRFIWPRVSHNGIVAYDNEHQLQIYLPHFDQYREHFSKHSRFFLSTGLYCFRDALLPELAVSRGAIKQFTPEIIAHVWYATREMNKYTEENGQPFSYLPDLERKQFHSELVFSVDMLENVGLYKKDVNYWHKLPCLSLRERRASLDQALELAKKGPIAFRTLEFQSLFYTNFVRYMLLKNFHIRYISDSNDYYLEGRLSDQEVIIPMELRSFEPMEFIESVNSTKVVLENHSFNLQHPLIKWFISNSNLIKRDFSYYGFQLRNVLLSQDTPDIKVVAVNEILERLRVLLPPETRPPIELNILDQDV